MKRFVWLVGLMALSSPACARDYSFVFRGHDIDIEAARHCRSLSCVSVLVGNRRNRRDRDDDEVATVHAGAPAPAQAQPLPAPVQTMPAARAPVAPSAVTAQPAAQPVQAPPAPPPAPLPPPPAKVVQPKPQLPARVEEAESDTGTPVGDWQTEGEDQPGAHRILRRRAVRFCARCCDPHQGRVRPDQHEAEGRHEVDRQCLQPCQRQQLLRHDDAEGRQDAAGRGLCAGLVLLLRQQLDPVRAEAGKRRRPDLLARDGGAGPFMTL